MYLVKVKNIYFLVKWEYHFFMRRTEQKGKRTAFGKDPARRQWPVYYNLLIQQHQWLPIGTGPLLLLWVSGKGSWPNCGRRATILFDWWLSNEATRRQSSMQPFQKNQCSQPDTKHRESFFARSARQYPLPAPTSTHHPSPALPNELTTTVFFSSLQK
jgi:hypothetical protein